MAIKEGWKINKLEDEKHKKIAIVGGGPARNNSSGTFSKTWI